MKHISCYLCNKLYEEANNSGLHVDYILGECPHCGAELYDNLAMCPNKRVFVCKNCFGDVDDKEIKVCCGYEDMSHLLSSDES